MLIAQKNSYSNYTTMKFLYGKTHIMALLTNGNPSEEVDNNNFPKWLEIITLNNAVREVCGEFKCIKNVQTTNYSKTIENVSTLMLRFHVEFECKDNSTKSINFILKTQNRSNEAITKILDMLKLFQKEEHMYQKIIPKFEQMYKEAGKMVKFSPKAYKFDRDIGIDYVLLEDLRASNYKTGNRLLGFDMEHMQEALTKLAEYHAASACYVEHFGIYTEEFTIGIYSQQNRELLKQFNNSMDFLAHLKKWKNSRVYYEKLSDCDNYLVDRLLEDQKYNPGEFNVLNHGDCWLNNIMFQYDAFGKIKNSLFVDFQVGKYGSPAYDLYYLILSSAAMNIKLLKFDYMVRFYYDKLIENLKLLQYHRPLPKLRNLHSSLLNNGLAAFMVVSKILPLVMLDTSVNLGLEDDIQDETKIKSAMYTNHKYVQAMSEILPWMDNRGLLDWKQ